MKNIECLVIKHRPVIVSEALALSVIILQIVSVILFVVTCRFIIFSGCKTAEPSAIRAFVKAYTNRE